MSTAQPTGSWAVVTGASAGLGADFARQLAAAGHAIVLAARREDRLEALSAELQEAYRVETLVVPVDLATAQGPEALFERATSDGRQVEILVNNAGFGTVGPHLSTDGDRQRMMLDLNVTALTDLTHRFANHMAGHGAPSHIVNIASVASFQPIPHMAVYAASKAYVRDFSQALSMELSGSNIAVTCVHPGGTLTEFGDVAGMTIGGAAKATMMASEDVVRIGLAGMRRGRVHVVTGWMNRIMTWVVAWSPRAISGRVAGWMMGRLRT
jgi:short-subunit dehydrogenase